MLTEKIDQIIDKRIGRGEYEGAGHLDYVKRQRDFFQQLQSRLKDFQTFRLNVLKQIESHSGEYYVMSTDDPAFEEKVIATDPSRLLTKLGMALIECDRLIRRFSRDTVNISVVGLARQGKSTLLQSITKLPDEIIPAAAGGDCTGAKSVICNAKGSKTYAEVTFYSEKELIDQLQKYLDVLDTGIVLGSLLSLQQIDLASVNQETTEKSSLLIHFKKYIGHFKEYKDYLGETITVDDASRIRDYVAQYGVDGHPTYFYLAVKEVRIFTEFRYKDAGKITLVDTIGIGDTSLGIKDKLIATLVDDSDAAVLVRRPSSDGDGVRNWDNNLYDLIKGNMRGLGLEKWLFYVLNVYEKNAMAADAMFKQLSQQIDAGSLKVASLSRINCADAEDVEKNLVIPILDNLATNLETIDSGLLARANDVFGDLYFDLYDLSGKVRAVLNNSFKKNMNIGGLFDRLFGDLPLFSSLRDLNTEYGKHKDEKCMEIETNILNILGRISQDCPDKKEILDKLRGGTINAQPDVVYSHYADHLRSKISDQFEIVTNQTLVALQEKVKSDIIDILYSPDGGALCNIPLARQINPEDRNEWLKEFISEKLENYPAVKNAFEYVLDYRLNIEGLVEYKVNASLEYLDPISKKFCRIDPRGLSDKESADLIEQSFLNAVNMVADDMLRSIAEMLTIPNNSFFARIRKFREKIAYSDEGNKELKELYRDNCVAVWKEEFSKQVKTQTALGAWTDFNSEIASMCEREKFNVKIA